MNDTLEQIVAEMREYAPCLRSNGIEEVLEFADRLAALATPTAREPVKVTDAMVEAAMATMGDGLGMRAALTAALGQHGGEAQCKHEWVISDNKYVTNASMCLKCHAVAATTDLPASPLHRQAQGVVTDDAVFRLAFWMAKKDGNDDPHLLIWERTSSDPPEPWGEVWQKYEDDARAALQAALSANQAEPGVAHYDQSLADWAAAKWPDQPGAQKLFCAAIRVRARELAAKEGG